MSKSAYTLPIEKTSKIAHMQMIKDRSLTSMLQSFKADDASSKVLNFSKTGQIDLGKGQRLKQILTIDGGLAVVPNPLSRRKSMGFRTKAFSKNAKFCKKIILEIYDS